MVGAVLSCVGVGVGVGVGLTGVGAGGSTSFPPQQEARAAHRMILINKVLAIFPLIIVCY